jgi:hypothetical protein
MCPNEYNRYKKTIEKTNKIIARAYKNANLVTMKLSEKQRNRLHELHVEENKINKELTSIEKQIKTLLKRKQKLSKIVSHNMKYRNIIIFPSKFNK